MTHTFHIPSRFHPGYSLLGRWLRRCTGDPRRAEAFHILILTGAALLLLLIHAVARALLSPPGGPTGGFWAVEAAFLLPAPLVGAWGRRPAAIISCELEVLRIEQGQRTLVLSYDAIETVETISPLRFHRHERRYAATCAFVGRLDHDLLLLKTTRGPVVVGPAPEDHATLRACLDRTCAASSLAQDTC